VKLQQLRVYLAVAEQQSIRGAARSVGLSQPAVTKTVRELEVSFGTPLIRRSVRGIELTEIGAAFAVRARLLVEEMRRATEEIEQMRTGATGTVNCAVSALVALTVFPVAYSKFSAQAPQAAVKVSEGGRALEAAQLRDGTLDFAIVHSLDRHEDDDFESITLFEMPLAICARRMHPLVGKRSLKHLLDAQWIAPTSGSDEDPMLRAIFQMSQLPAPRNVTWCPSFTTALGLLTHNDMISIFGQPLVPKFLRHHSIVPLKVREPLPKVVVSLITRKKGRPTPIAQRMMDCIVAACREFASKVPK
jgi:LysR family transcriptional regulator, regulator of abg operon